MAKGFLKFQGLFRKHDLRHLAHYSKSQIFVQKLNFDKTPTFSRVFHPKKIDNFHAKLSWIFGQVLSFRVISCPFLMIWDTFSPRHFAPQLKIETFLDVFQPLWYHSRRRTHTSLFEDRGPRKLRFSTTTTTADGGVKMETIFKCYCQRSISLLLAALGTLRRSGARIPTLTTES